MKTLPLLGLVDLDKTDRGNGVVAIDLPPGKGEAIVDDADYEWAKDYKWYLVREHGVEQVGTFVEVPSDSSVSPEFLYGRGKRQGMEVGCVPLPALVMAKAGGMGKNGIEAFEGFKNSVRFDPQFPAHN